MLKFNTHRTLIYLNFFTSPNPSPFSLLHFSTNTLSDSTSFAVSYLTQTFGFSPHLASKLCSTYDLHFETNQKPETVLNFFRNHGFSDTQLRHTIAKSPWLLRCDPYKRVLPKFQFFLSKGASTSDIVDLVVKNPMVLCPSLENQIVPTYELAYRFLQSHKVTLACAIHNPTFFGNPIVTSNIRLLIESGVANIGLLLRLRGRIFFRRDMLERVEEIKDLGFHPSKTAFTVALLAKTSVSKTMWKEKVDVFKKWGWSEKDVLVAFKKQPHCMLTSIDKINSVMDFWVNQLGWDAMAIAQTPRVFGASLEGRIIPRSSVVQYLLKKGFLNKNASLTSPFIVTDKTFVERYIKRFKMESSYLLVLYEEKLKLAHSRDKTSLS